MWKALHYKIIIANKNCKCARSQTNPMGIWFLLLFALNVSLYQLSNNQFEIIS